MAMPCGHTDRKQYTTCSTCRLYRDDGRYRDLFDGRPQTKPGRPHCVHLGGATGETHECGRCPKGRTTLKVFGCARHGRCSLDRATATLAGCADCPDYSPPGRVAVRDLAYYVLPVAGNGVWQSNVALLRRNLSLFNGRKVVAVATGGEVKTDDGIRPLDPPSAVWAALGPGVDTFELPNQPHLREAAALVPLLEALHAREAGRALFFAHAKGVTRPVNEGVSVHPWTDLLHEASLDYWPAVEEQLASHPVAGAFKKVGRGFAGSKSGWHYSGAFWWARSADLFARDWRRIDRRWWGVESYLGLHFAPSEAGCVFHEGRVPTLDLYSMEYLHGTVLPAWAAWKARHRHQRRACA